MNATRLAVETLQTVARAMIHRGRSVKDEGRSAASVAETWYQYVYRSVFHESSPCFYDNERATR